MREVIDAPAPSISYSTLFLSGWSKGLPHLANPGRARRGLRRRCRSGLTSFRSDWGLRHLAWLWIHVDRWCGSNDFDAVTDTNHHFREARSPCGQGCCGFELRLHACPVF